MPDIENMSGKKPKISRRGYLAGLGVAATSGCGLIGGASAAPSVTVTTAKSGDEPLIRKEVPRPWYQHIQHVRNVNSRLSEQYLSQPGVKSVASVRSPEKFGGKPGLQIRIERDADEFTGDLPTSVEGVPITTIAARERGLGGNCYNDDKDFSSVPGGVKVGTDSGYGTTCLPVNKGGSTKMLTCAHLWNACSGANIVGYNAYQGGDKFGEVSDFDKNSDWAVINPTSDESLDSVIHEDQDTSQSGGTDYDVSGYYTETGIADLIDNQTVVRKMGATSGLTKGAIKAKNVQYGFDCVGFEGRGVESFCNFGDGDSGGPCYNLESNSISGTAAVMVNVCQMWESGDTNKDYADCNSGARVEELCTGTAFYHLHDNYNISVA